MVNERHSSQFENVHNKLMVLSTWFNRHPTFLPSFENRRLPLQVTMTRLDIAFLQSNRDLIGLRHCYLAEDKFYLMIFIANLGLGVPSWLHEVLVYINVILHA